MGRSQLWRQGHIGDGYATPSVVGSRLYLLSNRGMENEFVQALSVEDGKPVWTTRLGNVGSPNQEPKMPKKKALPLLKVRNNASLREIYRRAREEFSAADLQKYTEVEEGIAASQVLAELEALDRELDEKPKRKSKNARTR